MLMTKADLKKEADEIRACKQKLDEEQAIIITSLEWAEKRFDRAMERLDNAHNSDKYTENQLEKLEADVFLWDNRCDFENANRIEWESRRRKWDAKLAQFFQKVMKFEMTQKKKK